MSTPHQPTPATAPGKTANATPAAPPAPLDPKSGPLDPKTLSATSRPITEENVAFLITLYSVAGGPGVPDDLSPREEDVLNRAYTRSFQTYDAEAQAADDRVAVEITYLKADGSRARYIHSGDLDHPLPGVSKVRLNTQPKTYQMDYGFAGGPVSYELQDAGFRWTAGTKVAEMVTNVASSIARQQGVARVLEGLSSGGAVLPDNWVGYRPTDDQPPHHDPMDSSGPRMDGFLAQKVSPKNQAITGYNLSAVPDAHIKSANFTVGGLGSIGGAGFRNTRENPNVDIYGTETIDEGLDRATGDAIALAVTGDPRDNVDAATKFLLMTADIDKTKATFVGSNINFPSASSCAVNRNVMYFYGHRNNVPAARLLRIAEVMSPFQNNSTRAWLARAQRRYQDTYKEPACTHLANSFYWNSLRAQGMSVATIIGKKVTKGKKKVVERKYRDWFSGNTKHDASSVDSLFADVETPSDEAIDQARKDQDSLNAMFDGLSPSEPPDSTEETKSDVPNSDGGEAAAASGPAAVPTAPPFGPANGTVDPTSCPATDLGQPAGPRRGLDGAPDPGAKQRKRKTDPEGDRAANKRSTKGTDPGQKSHKVPLNQVAVVNGKPKD